MPTRTVFLHISTTGKAVFYALAFLSLVVCLYGFYRRAELWRQGKPFSRVTEWPERLNQLWLQAIAHQRIGRRKYAGVFHRLIFFGLLVLFLGTVIVAIEHYGAYAFGAQWLYKGSFYLLCKMLLDLFGLGLLIGTGMAIARRYRHKSPALGHVWQDGAFLTLLFVATLTGFTLEGAGIAADPARQPYALFSPIGSLFALPMSGLSAFGYQVMWWIHIPLVLAVVAALPYGRWLHLFVIPATVVMQPDRPMGALEPISLTEVEQTGRIGLGAIADLDSWELMSLDGCMECGRCTDACPAHAVGKELNPKNIVLDLRRSMEAAHDKTTDILSDAALWACTNCHACVRECPALIRHVDLIDGVRRFRVAEGRLSGTAATMLRQLTIRENPWGMPADQRRDWTNGLDIPSANAQDGREILLWVGCAGAFEPSAQKTVRALARLLQRAGVTFTILGPKERCTGDPARRMGDEFLFQQLAESNIATLQEVGAKTIVTQCPHCFHTLKNEYPAFGGNYTVWHHTQFLARLVEQGRLTLPAGFTERLTYHDPCFLARVNNETEAPRRLLQNALTIPLVEVERRESKTFCCGAGGGRMWMEEERSQRPGMQRAEELLATGAEAVAVGCPFCKVMIGDSVAQAGGETPPILDIAEVMLAAITRSQAPGEPKDAADPAGTQPT